MRTIQDVRTVNDSKPGWGKCSERRERDTQRRNPR